MPTTVTRLLAGDAERKATIVRALLERAAENLEQLDRLLQAGQLDRRELQQAAGSALKLTLVAVEELDAY